MKNKVSDSEIMRALINQVMVAANGRSETEVVTFITKPMWRKFLKATGSPLNSKPTGWIGIKETIRVFGSHTIVVPSKSLASFSLLMEVSKDKMKSSVNRGN